MGFVEGIPMTSFFATKMFAIPPKKNVVVGEIYLLYSVGGFKTFSQGIYQGHESKVIIP